MGVGRSNLASDGRKKQEINKKYQMNRQDPPPVAYNVSNIKTTVINMHNLFETIRYLRT